jgi:hypothetical protein
LISDKIIEDIRNKFDVIWKYLKMLDTTFAAVQAACSRQIVIVLHAGKSHFSRKEKGFKSRTPI